MEHHTRVIELGEGAAQAECSYRWRSALHGLHKQLGTMDALQRARDAADLHQWDATFN